MYSEDLEIFKWMRQGAPVERRCIEAQIMDWSDDVSYSVHDLEDAIVAHQVDMSRFKSDLSHLHRVMADDYGMIATEVETSEAMDRLQSLSCWPTGFDGTHQGLAKIKDLTSQLIGRFVLNTEIETRLVHGKQPLARYWANLEVPRELRVEVALLKSIAGYYLIGAPIAQERYSKQRVVISELVEMIFENAPNSLDSIFLADWLDAESDQQKLRVVIDQVASLTDPGAYTLHSRLRAEIES